MVINMYVLRILAIFLIVNQHMTRLYPSPAFAFGGHLGNSIFFFLSGLALTISYDAKPLPWGLWLRKRYLKLVIPTVIFTFLTEITSLDHFGERLAYFLVPHSMAQLDQFLPNLVVLYLLFYGLNRLSARLLRGLAALVLAGTLGLYLGWFAQSVPPRPDLVSYGPFYALTALACFLFGMLAARARALDATPRPRPGRELAALAAFLGCMGLQILVKKNRPELLIANFYLNLASVLALYAASQAMNRASGLAAHATLLAGLATLSLAVFVIHFKVLYALEALMPRSFAAVGILFAASFALAYPATLLANSLIRRLRL